MQRLDANASAGIGQLLAARLLATTEHRVGPDNGQRAAKSLLALFALLVAVNLLVVCGNILVIGAVCASTKLRSVTNIFVVSLATADLLLGLLVLPYALLFEILDVWVFGEVWCRGWLVVDVWISTASILNLVAISLDRYIAVTRPVKYRSIMTAKVAKSMVATVWVVAFVICFPALLLPQQPASLAPLQSQLASRPLADATPLVSVNNSHAHSMKKRQLAPGSKTATVQQEQSLAPWAKLKRQNYASIGANFDDAANDGQPRAAWQRRRRRRLHRNQTSKSKRKSTTAARETNKIQTTKLRLDSTGLRHKGRGSKQTSKHSFDTTPPHSSSRALSPEAAALALVPNGAEISALNNARGVGHLQVSFAARVTTARRNEHANLVRAGHQQQWQRLTEAGTKSPTFGDSVPAERIDSFVSWRLRRPERRHLAKVSMPSDGRSNISICAPTLSSGQISALRPKSEASQRRRRKLARERAKRQTAATFNLALQQRPLASNEAINASDTQRAKIGCSLFHNKSYVVYSSLGSFYIPAMIMVFFYSRIYLVAARAQRAIKRGYMTTKWTTRRSKPLAAGHAHSHASQQTDACESNNNNKACVNRCLSTQASNCTLNSSTTVTTPLAAAVNISPSGKRASATFNSKTGGLPLLALAAANGKNGGCAAHLATSAISATAAACPRVERVTLRIHRRTAPAAESASPATTPTRSSSSLKWHAAAKSKLERLCSAEWRSSSSSMQNQCQTQSPNQSQGQSQKVAANKGGGDVFCADNLARAEFACVGVAAVAAIKRAASNEANELSESQASGQCQQLDCQVGRVGGGGGGGDGPSRVCGIDRSREDFGGEQAKNDTDKDKLRQVVADNMAPADGVNEPSGAGSADDAKSEPQPMTASTRRRRHSSTRRHLSSTAQNERSQANRAASRRRSSRRRKCKLPPPEVTANVASKDGLNCDSTTPTVLITLSLCGANEVGDKRQRRSRRRPEIKIEVTPPSGGDSNYSQESNSKECNNDSLIATPLIVEETVDDCGDFEANGCHAHFLSQADVEETFQEQTQEQSDSEMSDENEGQLNACHASRSERSQSVQVPSHVGVTDDGASEHFEPKRCGQKQKSFKLSANNKSSRVDRSLSFTPTPQIVVSWNPNSNIVDSQILQDRRVVASDGALTATPTTLANSNGGHAHSRRSKRGNGGDGRSGAATPTSAASGSSASIFHGLFAGAPSRMRKRSIQLVSSFNKSTAGQTLRHLSLVAAHPVDAILKHKRRRKSASSRDDSESVSASASRRTDLTASNASSAGHSNGSRRRRRQHPRRSKRTLDDYLMGVAGIDSTSSSSSSLSSLESDDFDENYDQDYDSGDYSDDNSELSDGSLEKARNCGDDVEGACQSAMRASSAAALSILVGENSTSKLLEFGAPKIVVNDDDDEDTEQHEPRIGATRAYMKLSPTQEISAEPSSKLELGIDEALSTDLTFSEEPSLDKQQFVAGEQSLEPLTKIESIATILPCVSKDGAVDNKVDVVPVSALERLSYAPGSLPPANSGNNLNNKRKKVRRFNKLNAKKLHERRFVAEYKIALTIAVIVGGFCLCWLPFFSAYLYRSIGCSSKQSYQHSETFDECVPSSLLSLFTWLGYLNSALNPIIFGLFSPEFRLAFKNIILGRCWQPL